MKKIFLLTCLMFFCSTMCFAQDNTVTITTNDIRREMQDSLKYAYLYIGLRNDGNEKINNLNLEISYYTNEEFLIEKDVVKNALNESIPPGEERKYKISLGYDGTFSDVHYPFDQDSSLHHYKVKITDVKVDLLEKIMKQVGAK